MTDTKISEETHTEAMKIAKGIQKPGQTKDQTKLVAQGIEKGIAEYKKQQKSKAREKDKQRKKDLKARANSEEATASTPQRTTIDWVYWLPWVGTTVTLLYFVVYPLISARG